MNKTVDLIKQAERDCALAFANFELDQHNLRVNVATRSPEARYFLSTPNKLHMSSLLYIAWATNAPITKSQAAAKIHISRQAASDIIDQAVAANWVVEENGGYRYSDENGEYYAQVVPMMLEELSSNLTKTIANLQVLRDLT